jgi:hypothetical protein
MKDVELYGRVRYAVRIEGLSERAAARRFGIDPRTVNKMMKFSVPPGYVRKKPPAKPKLDPFISVIDSIFWGDKSRPKKEQVKPCSSRSRSKIRFAVCLRPSSFSRPLGATVARSPNRASDGGDMGRRTRHKLGARDGPAFSASAQAAGGRGLLRKLRPASSKLPM